SPQKRFAPSSFCVNSTATARRALNTMVSAAETLDSASAGCSARRHFTPMASSTGTVACPIGNCHGLPSPKSPRMLTSVRNGNRPPLMSESMLMQLPTPLLHQQHAAFAAEIGAREQRHALLFGRERNGMNLGIGERTVDQDLVAGIGHIGELRHPAAAQQIVYFVLPGLRRALAFRAGRLRAHRKLPLKSPSLAVNRYMGPFGRAPYSSHYNEKCAAPTNPCHPRIARP